MIPLDRVRAMLRLGSDAAQESWTWRYDDADGCRVIENPRARFEEERRIAEMCASSDADAALIAAAPDLARDVLTLAAALATAERERDELRERDAFLTRERIAVATALDVPYATPLGEAVATRLARLTTERDAAREARATLAWAIEKEREALEDFDDAESEVREADASPASSLRTRLELRARRDAALTEHAETRRATTALLSAAPPRSTVPARVVREYLAAESAWREGIGAYLPGEDVTAYVARRDAERARVNELHSALWAALAGCV